MVKWISIFTRQGKVMYVYLNDESWASLIYNDVFFTKEYKANLNEYIPKPHPQ